MILATEQENLLKNLTYDIKQDKIQVLWRAGLELSDPEKLEQQS